MHRIIDRSVRRSSRRWGHVLLCALAGAAAALGCSIYSSPDGPESLETGGSSGSAGSTDTGGSSSSGGSDADGGSMSSAGQDGGKGGSSGSGSGTGGGDGGSGGSDGGSTGSGGSTGGNGGDVGAGGSAGTGAAGSGGSAGIVELALNKPATGSSDQPIHTYAHGNDGATGTRWCAVVGTFPEHWRTDLGANYELTSFEVRWEKNNRDYTYEVATSLDDINYTPQVTRTASGQVQTGSMMPGTMGRYVRITVTAATGNTWASFFEFKVFGR
jgi:hypothetical protein